MLMDVLIVGSLAYDSLKTPVGQSEDELGGSASYGGFAASFHNHRNSGNGVSILGVVGDDFEPEHLQWYEESEIDISGIETAEGKTFRWTGSYHGNMAEAITHETQLNVFEYFEPKIPNSHKSPKVLMCANLLPSIQTAVLDQVAPSRLTVLDSMNLWIEIANEELLKVIKRVEVLILNDGETRMLAGDDNLLSASQKVLELKNGGILIVKRGEHGVIAFHPDGIISLPAYPTSNLVDPTGCGDSFAGALCQHLSKQDGLLDRDELIEGLIHATITASFTIEDFGVKSLRNIQISDYDSRYEEYKFISNLK